jgi:predicted enzyme related to lactoylglutathione lyase
MTDQPFGLGRLRQVLVPVTDVDRATAFYRDQLGIPFLFSAPGAAFFEADGVRLYLATPDQPGFAGIATLYFGVNDIHAAVAALGERGVAFGDGPHVVHRDGTMTLWMAFAKDPDGNNIGLMSEVFVRS